jgi:hypothetical protein
MVTVSFISKILITLAAEADMRIQVARQVVGGQVDLLAEEALADLVFA